MGGQWIPESFVPAHHLWGNVATFVGPNGFFNVVAIRRKSPDELSLFDREGNKAEKFNDELIEVFSALKDAGDDSAMVVHRGLQQCWITSWPQAESYLKNQNDEQDAAYRT